MRANLSGILVESKFTDNRNRTFNAYRNSLQGYGLVYRIRIGCLTVVCSMQRSHCTTPADYGFHRNAPATSFHNNSDSKSCEANGGQGTAELFLYIVR